MEAMDCCCSRICNLVITSLLPYIEMKRCRLTEEMVKEMLLSLSMVSRKIKQWASEYGGQFKRDTVANVWYDHDCSQILDQPFKGDYNCLANIVTIMVSFLDVDNQFVQHVAANILSSLSDFITKDVIKWVEFIHMLLFSLEATISSIRSSTSLSSSMKPIVLYDGSLMHCYPLTIDDSLRTEDLCFDFTRFTALLLTRLQKVNFFIVAALFRVLRNILKSLKLENGDLERVFMNLVVSSIINLPWDLFSGIHVSQSFVIDETSGKVDLLDSRKGSNGIKGTLLGTVLQLFCSLVAQNDPDDEGGGPLGELSVHSKFINLLPQLLSVFSKCLRHTDKDLSHYLRYKMLILMYRLSFHHQWCSSHPATWLRLLRHYFDDLIFKSMSECTAGSENCLEGSPFLASIDDGDTCTRHLQRLAIFLHFKCCFALVHLKEPGQGCACTNKTLSLTVGLQPCSEKCSHMGLVELSEWLKRCDVLEISTDTESRSSFALSFLQLYMEEDDMLFGMLLLLFDAPFFALQEQNNATEKYSRETERDALLYIKNLFDPIHLFHWFLLLLHYDHLVLVDYLISKDTGVQSAQYLLSLARFEERCTQ